MSTTAAEASAETAAGKPADPVPATEAGAAARRLGRAALLPVLGAALLVAVVLNLGIGAVSIAPGQVLGILADKLGLDVGATWTDQQAAVLEAIRAPRVLMCALVGAVLAVSGAALQGVFRNPLADPSVIGVSSGAAVGAVAAIVFGAGAAGTGAGNGGTGGGGLGAALTPVAAFVGGLLAALAVYAMSRRDGRTEVVTMVLTGVAVSAICGAFVGLLTFLADDAQLRSIVFWSLGSMGGATWQALTATTPMLVAGAVLLPLFGRPLNALVLGEREARHLGVDTERVRLAVVGLAALGTGASVSIAGIVGFVGLVTPHLLRLIAGPDHRLLLPASALGGAVLLLAADLAARTVVVPAELPLGVVTALAGGPFFLFLLLRTRRSHGGWG
jgi:iron complex transport system permease protein